MTSEAGEAVAVSDAVPPQQTDRPPVVQPPPLPLTPESPPSESADNRELQNTSAEADLALLLQQSTTNNNGVDSTVHPTLKRKHHNMHNNNIGNNNKKRNNNKFKRQKRQHHQQQQQQQQQQQNQHRQNQSQQQQPSGGPAAIHNNNHTAELENKSNNNAKKKHQVNNVKKPPHFKPPQHGRNGRSSFPSKFFLPDKRPPKELIVPPTKFLLGGNISDPLNLNSLQAETINASMNAATPKSSSSVTTPPKVEVIIPPNIHDPLHLLDPVDSIEYEKQLTSPLKRKHRNRKKKPRKRHDKTDETASSQAVSLNSTMDTSGESVETMNNESKNESVTSTDANNKSLEETGVVVEGDKQCGSGEVSEREKVIRDLKLDLSGCEGGRKRRVSENGNCKNKIRRMDSMDKIVSPVIPQPGAWKRPPRTIPTGPSAARRRLKSLSQPDDLLSPIEEGRSIEQAVEPKNSAVVDTPTVEKPPIPTEPAPQEAESTSDDTKDIKTAPAVATSPKSQPVASTSTAKPNSNSTQRKKPLIFEHGNYNRYYGYRNMDEFMDVRLKVFFQHRDLFKNKDILDIGCNAGHLTIAVAKAFNPKSIVGIDIDKNLIDNAKRNVAMFVRIPIKFPDDELVKSKEDTKTAVVSEEDKAAAGSSGKEVAAEPTKDDASKKTVDGDGAKPHVKHRFDRRKGGKKKNNPNFFPISFPVSLGGIPDVINEREGEQRLFPKNIKFVTANYVLKDESLLSCDTQRYDLIMCLSVTKWIHLNNGDAGLKLAFKRMFNQLRPGGKLILEAQNWASYKKKKKLTDTIYNNYKSIEFFPNAFHEYLVGPEVGFSHSISMGTPRHLSKGFERPILLYVKGDYTPSQCRWSDNYHPQTPYEPYRGIYADVMRPPPLASVYANCGNYSYRFTPSQACSTSQYYNPLESENYLPSYAVDVRRRHYAFASPLYSTVWSPPPGRRSASHTPTARSQREADAEPEGNFKPHVYPPTDTMGGDCSLSPPNPPLGDVSPRLDQFNPVCDNLLLSSPRDNFDGGMMSPRVLVGELLGDSMSPTAAVERAIEMSPAPHSMSPHTPAGSGGGDSTRSLDEKDDSQSAVDCNGVHEECNGVAE